jgi:hypothetical protein
MGQIRATDLMIAENAAGGRAGAGGGGDFVSDTLHGYLGSTPTSRAAGRSVGGVRSGGSAEGRTIDSAKGRILPAAAGTPGRDGRRRGHDRAAASRRKRGAR